jgi:hypothetical protein
VNIDEAALLDEVWLVAEAIGAIATVASLIVLNLEIRMSNQELHTANTTAAVQR